MIDVLEIIKGKTAFVFELDDVLYLEKDYDLQVFYLFANLLEYTEGVPVAADLTAFLKKSYEMYGNENLFQKAAEVFGIDQKYEENFKRMKVNAQLPLRLIISPPVLELLHSIHKANKAIYLLTKGNPLVQLNKIKYVDWEGLEKHLKVYFYDEIKVVRQQEPLQYLLEENELKTQEVLFIGRSEQEHAISKEVGVDFLNVSRLL